MALLPHAFDANQVEPGGKIIAEPAFVGWHPMHIVESEMSPTKKGGHQLVLTAQVLDGQWKGRKLWVRLNLDNASQQAVDIAYRELSAICRAVGRMNIADSQQLHHVAFMGMVEFEAATDKGPARNNVVQYKPMEGGAPVAATAYAPPAPPAAASAAPPWARKAG